MQFIVLEKDHIFCKSHNIFLVIFKIGNNLKNINLSLDTIFNTKRSDFFKKTRLIVLQYYNHNNYCIITVYNAISDGQISGNLF